MISEIVAIGMMVVNIVVLVIIKFNDLKHLEKSVDGMSLKVDDLCNRVSKIEGHLNIN